MQLCKPCFDAGFISDGSCFIKDVPTCANCSQGIAPSDTKDPMTVIPKSSIPVDIFDPKGQSALLMLALKSIPMGKAILFLTPGLHEHAGHSAKNYQIRRLRKFGVHAAGKAKGRFVWLWRVR